MNRHRINWEIPNGRYVDESRTTKMSELKYEHGWTLQCVWFTNSMPAYIMIRRETADGDLLICGKLALFHNGLQVLQKKYMQLMESGSTFITLGLEYGFTPPQGESSGASFSLKGYVNISSYLEKPNNLMTSLLGLSADFKQLLNTETSCIPPDVNLKCGGSSIPAHKFVLSARSPVFRAMFTNPTSESGDVAITDMSVSILRLMVRYMYVGWSITGNTTVTSVGHLLVAAGKYRVFSLVADCRDFLMEKISPQNVLLLLTLGDEFAKELKSFALDYICQCPEFSNIQNSEAWRSLETDKPALFTEVLSSLVKSKDEQIKRFRAY